MYNSPGTPGGTGRRPASRTYTCVFAIGRPMRGERADSRFTSHAVDQMVVSVGPYRLVTDTARSASATARSAGSASPPISTRSRSTTAGSCASTARHKLGVACITDAPVDTASSHSAAGSRTTSRAATTTPAPLSSGTNSSRPAMSNPTVVTASRRSSAPRANRSRIDTRKLTSGPCGTTTPFGRPVEPDV
ncbi:hypothetical protein SGLAM104S_00281 [Streptomyces glaucescens]